MKKMEWLNSKNLVLIFGLILSILSVVKWPLLIPGCVLICLYGLFSLEFSKKLRHEFEVIQNHKFEAYEIKLSDLKTDVDQLSKEMDALKSRLSAISSFNKGVLK